MMRPDLETSRDLLKRLKYWRRTLAHYLDQVAINGSAHTPPEVTHGISEARSNIQDLKVKLQALGVSVTDHLDDSDEYIDKINFRARRMRILLLPILIGLLLLLAIVAIWIASSSSTERGIDLQTTEALQPVSSELPSATPPPTIAPNNTLIPMPLPTPSPAPVQIAIRNFKVRLDNREILIDPGGTIEVREGDVLMLEVVFDNAPDGLIFVWTSERNFIPLTTTSTSSTIYNVPTGSGANLSPDTVKVEIRSGDEILIERRFFVNIK